MDASMHLLPVLLDPLVALRVPLVAAIYPASYRANADDKLEPRGDDEPLAKKANRQVPYYCVDPLHRTTSGGNKSKVSSEPINGIIGLVRLGFASSDCPYV